MDESNKKEIVDEEAFVPNICDIPPELWNQVCIMKKDPKRNRFYSILLLMKRLPISWTKHIKIKKVIESL